MGEEYAPDSPRSGRNGVRLNDDFGFSCARGIREHFEALLANPEYEGRSGDLLDANEVKIARYKISQIFRDRMLQVPGTVVARLHANVREHGTGPDERAVHCILSEEIRSALVAFANQMRGAPA